MTTNYRSFCLLKPQWLQWAYYNHNILDKGACKEALEVYLHTATRFQNILEEIECNVMFLILVFFFSSLSLSPVLPTTRKVSLLHPLYRERAGVKSAWFALMRPQGVIMEFSPVAVARSSSKGRSKVRAHDSANIRWLWWVCVTFSFAEAIVVLDLSHNHFRLKDYVTVNGFFFSLKCLLHWWR